MRYIYGDLHWSHWLPIIVQTSQAMAINRKGLTEKREIKLREKSKQRSSLLMCLLNKWMKSIRGVSQLATAVFGYKVWNKESGSHIWKQWFDCPKCVWRACRGADGAISVVRKYYVNMEEDSCYYGNVTAYRLIFPSNSWNILRVLGTCLFPIQSTPHAILFRTTMMHLTLSFWNTKESLLQSHEPQCEFVGMRLFVCWWVTMGTTMN